MTFRRAATTVSTLAIVFSIAGPVDAYRPVLHEPIPDDPSEDARLGATTADGKLPAALETRSGIVRAPEMKRAPDPARAAYAEPLGAGTGTSYQADRSTGKPDAVGYSDPFTPTVAPYKRMRAFDDVGADYELKVHEPGLVREPAYGEKRPDEDVFYGDLSVDLSPGQSVRIPSVAAGSRVLRLSAEPAVSLELSRDGAENWFVSAGRVRGRVRIVFEMAAPRASFGGAFSLGEAEGPPPSVPPGVLYDAARVAEAAGISQGMSRGEILESLVAYFRGFSPSRDPPPSERGIYLDLALSRKGVCRHRAYAFTITALALGIASRMVLNEAHAWVEVLAGRAWHRIDLGGAADRIAMGQDDRPAYRPPADPFAWPPAAERATGAAAVETSLGTGGGEVDGGDVPVPAPTTGTAPTPDKVPAAEPDKVPAVRVVVKTLDAEVRRGGPLRLEGRVARGETPCARVLVDVSLAPRRGGAAVPLGALATDAQGEVRGAVHLPMRIDVGDYDVVVSAESCGAGE